MHDKKPGGRQSKPARNRTRQRPQNKTELLEDQSLPVPRKKRLITAARIVKRRKGKKRKKSCRGSSTKFPRRITTKGVNPVEINQKSQKPPPSQETPVNKPRPILDHMGNHLAKRVRQSRVPPLKRVRAVNQERRNKQAK